VIVLRFYEDMKIHEIAVMKMSRVQRTLATAVATLLNLTLALAASGGTSETTTDFPAAVTFELGKAEFLPGDSITIQQIRGTSFTIVTGGACCVEGTYTLASKEEADLALFATTVSDVSSPIDPSQHTRIATGKGKFCLVKTMRQEGYLHKCKRPRLGSSLFLQLCTRPSREPRRSLAGASP
jgi:hypothetical protein